MRIKLKFDKVLLNKSTSLDLLSQMRTAYGKDINASDAEKIISQEKLTINSREENGKKKFFLSKTFFDPTKNEYITEDIFTLYLEGGKYGEKLS